MPDNLLSATERTILLTTARDAITRAANHQALTPPSHQGVPSALLQEGASFVTLTIDGDLRGCIGALEAYQPLLDDVWEHAIAAAMEDYRFRPVQPYELSRIRIEISRLTAPVKLDYKGSDDLLSKLQPNVDGVILREGRHRATFLPQVWEKLPRPEDFLTHLCLKMGAPGDYWQIKVLEVSTYRVEEFHE